MVHLLIIKVNSKEIDGVHQVHLYAPGLLIDCGLKIPRQRLTCLHLKGVVIIYGRGHECVAKNVGFVR